MQGFHSSVFEGLELFSPLTFLILKFLVQRQQKQKNKQK
jgi:hypothetical protein